MVRGGEGKGGGMGRRGEGREGKGRGGKEREGKGGTKWKGCRMPACSCFQICRREEIRKRERKWLIGSMMIMIK